jgi:hypothetical protein
MRGRELGKDEGVQEPDGGAQIRTLNFRNASAIYIKINISRGFLNQYLLLPRSLLHMMSL